MNLIMDKFVLAFYGMLQSNGDAVIMITSDFQTPLELIPKLISKWKLDKNKVIFTKEFHQRKIYLLKKLENFFTIS